MPGHGYRHAKMEPTSALVARGKERKNVARYIHIAPRFLGPVGLTLYVGLWASTLQATSERISA